MRGSVRRLPQKSMLWQSGRDFVEIDMGQVARALQ
jgi:hypothetical protein